MSTKSLNKYERYRVNATNPMTLDAWVAYRNKESSGLFLAEMVAVGGVVLGLSLGAAYDFDDSAPSGFGAVIFALGVLSLPPMLIIDAIDIGEVR